MKNNMKITIEPTIHDSAYINGESKDGEEDWITFDSASVSFDTDQNIFEKITYLLKAIGWNDKQITEELDIYYEQQEDSITKNHD